MVLNQRSWRNINCELGKIRYCLISISVSLYQCFKGGFCCFVYKASTYLFTYAFIHFVPLVRRLTVTFSCFTKKERNIQTLVEVLFLVCKKTHNSNKKLLTLILSSKSTFLLQYKSHKTEFITKFRKPTTNCNKKAFMIVAVLMLQASLLNQNSYIVNT